MIITQFCFYFVYWKTRQNIDLEKWLISSAESDQTSVVLHKDTLLFVCSDSFHCVVPVLSSDYSFLQLTLCF